jgi:rRNA processing protein Krr1/Pno1
MHTSSVTIDASALQKAADFVNVFALDFDVGNAIALFRMTCTLTDLK